MSKKREVTPNAKVLTAILIVLFLGACICFTVAFCTGNIGKDIDTVPPDTVPATEASATTPDSPSDTVPQTSASNPSAEATSASVTTEAMASQLTLGSPYSIDYWVEYKDEHGTSGLGVLFGAHTTGGSVAFSDGRFAVNSMGSGALTEVSTGTYSFISDTEIELRFDNSNITFAKILETSDNVVTSMDFPMDVEGTTLRITLE